MVANYTKLYEKDKIFGNFLQDSEENNYEISEIGT